MHWMHHEGGAKNYRRTIEGMANNFGLSIAFRFLTDMLCKNEAIRKIKLERFINVKRGAINVVQLYQRGGQKFRKSSQGRGQKF